MDFTAIGSIHNYMKVMKLQTKWQQKQFSGSLTAKEDGNAAVWQGSPEQDEGGDKMLTGIYAKLENGSKLTAEELQYLKYKDPMAYQRLKALEAEKAGYEQALKRCRTKEDVQRLKMMKINSVITAVRSVESNPNIPDERKLEIIWGEHQRMAAVDKITTRFVESGEFQALPTDAERLKAERDLKEAEKAEREVILDKASEDGAAATDKAEVKQTDDADATAPGTKKAVFDAEKTETKKILPVAEKTYAEKTQVLGDGKMTRAESEQTPEARKIRRARRQRPAYPPSGDRTDPVSVRPPFEAKA